MPRVVLVSHLVAYNVYTLAAAQDKQTPYSARGLQATVPAAAVEAANAAVVVKIGGPDSWTVPTTISQPEIVLNEGENDRYPDSHLNNINLREKWINASVDNAVVYLNIEVA